MIYINRLLKGVIFAGASLFFMFHEFSPSSLGIEVNWQTAIERWAQNQSEFMSGLTQFLYFVAVVASLIFLVKGFYFTFSCHIERHPTFEGAWKQTSWSTWHGGSNIDRMKEYRESKLSTMTTSEAANEYKATAWLDGYCEGKSTQSAIRYIDSKLSAMTNEEGYQWLKR